MLDTSLIGHYFTVLSTYVFQNWYVSVKTDSTITICTFTTYNLVTAVFFTISLRLRCIQGNMRTGPKQEEEEEEEQQQQQQQEEEVLQL
jgi:hypothetical protein